jgi:hypothetical protein
MTWILPPSRTCACQAVATFLKDMSLTPADAAKRPQLLDALLSYHVIPYVKGTGAKMVPGGWLSRGTGQERRGTIWVCHGPAQQQHRCAPF